jgi:hypothetical protein
VSVVIATILARYTEWSLGSWTIVVMILVVLAFCYHQSTKSVSGQWRHLIRHSLDGLIRNRRRRTDQES